MRPVAFQNFMTVTSLQVFETDFQKSELLYVPARPFHSLTFRCVAELYAGKKVYACCDTYALPGFQGITAFP